MIRGEKCDLRPLEFSDLETLQQWSNDEEILNLLGGWHFPVSTREHESWYQSITNNFLNRRFAVEVNGRLVGTANLVNINWKDRNAFHGMMLGDKSIRGKGIGEEVVNLIMKYSFLELGLNRLDGDIISYNSASMKLYTQKCGWEIEGCQKEWYFRNNSWHDRILVGITKAKYLQKIVN
jgi:RimJ/RimL family protein N-acetyltransferase